MRIMVRKAGTASLTLPHLILTTLIIMSEPTRIKAAALRSSHDIKGGRGCTNMQARVQQGASPLRAQHHGRSCL